MARPEVSVVMPFAGELEAAREAIASLLALETEPGDQLILSDNAGALAAEPPTEGVEIVPAIGERSPARARNAGAGQARGEWILFIDADCRAPRDLLEVYFSGQVADDVGALAGEVVPAADVSTVAERYATARSFLSQEAHLAHPYRPRAVAANLLVRRAAFEQVAGFYEGLRAAEDTDFSWRLQEAGWRIELRPGAVVAHRYRASVGDLRRQWRGYAAGRAWLARRYDAFRPQPAATRALRRLRARRAPSPPRAARQRVGGLDRARFFALDALLAGDELAGFALSNRPHRDRVRAASSSAVLVADRFPAAGDPLVELARTIDGARVEAVARPEPIDAEAERALRIDYREDDGIASRGAALIRLAARHPVRCVADKLRRGPESPSLSALAPAALRLERDRTALVHPLGSGEAQTVAERLASLAGRSVVERRSR